MAAPVLYPGNLLEVGTVTVSGADADFPQERLYDRDVALEYRDDANSGNREIQNELATARPLDTWIVPPGHNLAGVSLTLRSSTDAFVSVDVVRDTVVVADDGIIGPRSVLQYSTKWTKLRAASPTSAPTLTELILSLGYPIPSPLKRRYVRAIHGNVSRFVSTTGAVWKAKRGPSRWRGEWEILATDSERDVVDAAFAAAEDGAKPFYLTDVEGIARWVEWTNDAVSWAYVPAKENLWATTLVFVEAS